MRRELELVHERVSSAQGAELERLLSEQDRLHHQLEAVADWDAERNVEVVLSGIGLGPQFWEREAATLSAGERPVISPRNDLREAPSRTGRESDVTRSSRRRISSLCAGVFPKPIPGSTQMRRGATPATSASRARTSSQARTSSTTSW